jgi:pentose-5-phosphate-3-epimerase
MNKPLEFPEASELASRVSLMRQEGVQKELSDILAKINSLGKMRVSMSSITYDGSLFPETVDFLKSKGYEVTNTNARNETIYRISWAHHL